MADVFMDLVCTKCQDSRYRSLRPLTGAEKLAPELFVPLGEQPPAEVYDKEPLCYACDSKLRAMPAAKSDSPKTLAEAKARAANPGYEESEAQPPKSSSNSLGSTIFECQEGESDLDMVALPSGKLLIKTSRRLFVLNPQEIA